MGLAYALLVLGFILGFIIGQAWPEPEKKEPEKLKPIGYDSNGQVIYEQPKNKLDVLA